MQPFNLPSGLTAAQQQRIARRLHDEIYNIPEIHDDDIPQHLRNSPTWVDLYGER
jgi:hypothetical protein